MEFFNCIGKYFFVRLYNCGNCLFVEVSKDGEEWIVFVSDMDVFFLYYNNYGGFYVLCVGLFFVGKGSLGFSCFCYWNVVL